MVASLRPNVWTSQTWLNQPPKFHELPHEYYPTITSNRPFPTIRTEEYYATPNFARMAHLNPKKWGGSPVEPASPLLPIKWGCSPVKLPTKLNPHATPFDPSHFKRSTRGSEVSTAGESASEVCNSAHGSITEEPLITSIEKGNKTLTSIEKGNKIDPSRSIRFMSCVEEDDLFFDASDKSDVEVPNPGSELHGTGLCRPCAWFHGPRSCGEVDTCNYCHLCPANELKKRRALKIRAMKSAEFIATMGWDSDSEYQPDLPITTNYTR